MPTLSLVIPVYNVAPFLRQCLDSVLNQTETGFEIIAVNDGSTDESPDILREYEQIDPKRFHVFHKENGGLSDARNFGVEKASGEWIAFLDSDDTLAPHFAQRILTQLEENKPDLILFDFDFLLPSGKVSPSAQKVFSPQTIKKEILLSSPMAWRRVYRKSLLGKDPFQKGIYYEDLEMTPRMALSAEKAVILKDVLYHYRQREGSIMREKFSPRFLDIFSVLDSVLAFFEKEGKREEYEKELEFLFIEHLLRSAALRFSSSKEGRLHFPRLIQRVKKDFPHWQKNPYFAQTSLYFRTVAQFAAKGAVGAVLLLSKRKG